ncbi:hypothetical protein NOVO_01880 [Rickettsiales bacterium Ac37b]|nr:hypothetical protein NOVO_01880 [Rickettsiales bacterium Ac37b]
MAIFFTQKKAISYNGINPATGEIKTFNTKQEIYDQKLFYLNHNDINAIEINGKIFEAKLINTGFTYLGDNVIYDISPTSDGAGYTCLRPKEKSSPFFKTTLEAALPFNLNNYAASILTHLKGIYKLIVKIDNKFYEGPEFLNDKPFLSGNDEPVKYCGGYIELPDEVTFAGTSNFHPAE